jgi:hypothetical protein
MSGSVGSMFVPADIDYSYSMTYDSTTGTTSLSGQNKSFPTYTVSVNNNPIFVSPQDPSKYGVFDLFGPDWPVGKINGGVNNGGIGGPP